MAKKGSGEFGPYVLKHGNQYYLKLPIPHQIRHLFLSKNGKPKTHIVEPLGDSPSAANEEARYRVAWCTDVITRIKAGLLTTPERVADAMRGPSEPDVALEPAFEAMYERNRKQTKERNRLLAELGVPRELRAKVDRALLRALARPTSRMLERQARWFEEYGASVEGAANAAKGAAHAAPDGAKNAPDGAPSETISQAAEAWFAELTRDETAAPRPQTLAGHRLRVRAFVDAAGDNRLSAVTRATASDFLAGLDVSNRTRNAYGATLRSVFECARRRGRFTGEDPFDGMKAKVAGSSYQPFTVAELQTLFDAMPREVRSKKHTPDTALPWVALIALYTGARLEEIAQLTTADVREASANGARVWCIDIHNGGENKLKNETSARLIPVHSELVRLGLLDYVKALKAGSLFPGLTRRASKGGKVGARVGELFRKKLVALKLKRDGLCFHSFRHNVATALRVAGVPQEDAARVLGHAVPGMSYGTYAQAGPGLKRVAAVVEMIMYEGLRL
jgi:integrase